MRSGCMSDPINPPFRDDRSDPTFPYQSGVILMRKTKLKGNVFVGNLPENFTDGRLAELFDPYGIVVGAYLARDVNTGELQNYGLVDLAPKKAVQTAVQQLNGALVDGNRIEVRATEVAIALPKPRARSPIPISRQAPKRVFQVEYRSIARRI